MSHPDQMIERIARLLCEFELSERGPGHSMTPDTVLGLYPLWHSFKDRANKVLDAVGDGLAEEGVRMYW